MQMDTLKPFCASDSSVACMFHLSELLKVWFEVHVNEYVYILTSLHQLTKLINFCYNFIFMYINIYYNFIVTYSIE